VNLVAPNDLAFSGEPAVLEHCRFSKAWRGLVH